MSNSNVDSRDLALITDHGDDAEVSPWETSSYPNQAIPRRTFNARDWAPDNLLNFPANNGPTDDNDGEEEGVVSVVSPLPLRQRLSPMLDDTFNFDISQAIREEISGLEGTQNALLEQIRDLELAHAQLSAARGELLRVLAVLENENEESARQMLDAAHQRIIQNYERQSQQRELLSEEQERQESYDFYEEILANQTATTIPTTRSISRRFPIDDDDDEGLQPLHDSDLEMFLDENGNPCFGFEDCIQRAVGWSGEKTDFLDFGIDRNGEEIEDKSTIEVEPFTMEAPLR